MASRAVRQTLATPALACRVQLLVGRRSIPPEPVERVLSEVPFFNCGVENLVERGSLAPCRLGRSCPPVQLATQGVQRPSQHIDFRESADGQGVPPYSGSHNEVGRSWLPWPGRELSVRSGVGTSPWIVSDELWAAWSRCCRSVSAGSATRARRALPDREVLCGILYVLHTGIQWEYLPQELGFGSGMTCWRRLRDWNEAGV
ncbi:transposase [Streptomyces platensis]|uniref:Transposase n=1 Tax=Streptomyces platensis TaxID=58346 RepID=A0AAE6NNZ0_STRPT|nr:transposase [Streptomyces platensis]QEV56053.1 transposase [Streptomyces platensis]